MPKLARYREHGIPVMFGGTLTEIAIAQNRLDALVAKLHELGLEHIELSDGTINLDHDRKLELIARAGARSSPCCPRSAPRTTRGSWRRFGGWSRSRQSSRPAPGR